MKNQILDLSKRLISVKSEKSNLESIKKLSDLSISELCEYKHKTFNKNGVLSDLFYNTSKLPERFKIILNAHIDVVPAAPTQYKTVVEEGKLYGRGAIDMKAAAAVEMLIFKELANKVKYPLGLMLVTDEEVGGFNGTKYVIEKGITADFVIIGEPTNLAINNKAKGIIWMKLVAKGKSAHSAYPWKGENALTKIAQSVSAITHKYPFPKKESWKTTYNLAWIKTPNETSNKVPDFAEAMFDIRYIPEEKGKIVPTIKKLIHEDVSIELVMNEPPQYTNEKNEYLKLLRRSIENVTNKKSKVIAKHAGSDLRHFNVANIDGVLFGPVGDGQHTENEWVDIKSLETYYEVLKDFLLSLDK